MGTDEKFELGQVVTTPNAIEQMASIDPDGNHRRIAAEMLCRHHKGDWGDVDDTDAQSNEIALNTGARLVSLYSQGGHDFLVITEAEGADGVRPSTTVLLPEDY
jgi:hypothetical protein